LPINLVVMDRSCPWLWRSRGKPAGEGRHLPKGPASLGQCR
jgi:hypothetical protein